MSIVAIKVFIISTVQSVYFYLFYHTTVSSKSFERILITHFQKDCRPGASMVRGQLWDRLEALAHLFLASCAPNDPTTKRMPSLARASTIFESGLCNCAIRCKEFRK